MLNVIKEGMTCKEVYLRALGYIKEKKPSLESHLPKNIGFSTGIEFQERPYLLSIKNERPIKSGMIFILSLGFLGLSNNSTKDKLNSNYALLLSDTIKITSNGAELLTEAPRDLKDISYMFKDELEAQGIEDDDENSIKLENGRGDKGTVFPSENSKDSKSSIKVKSELATSRPGAKTRVLTSKLRGDERPGDLTNEQRRRAHQRSLAEQKQNEGLEKFGGEDGDRGLGSETKYSMKKYESYKKEGQLPTQVKDMKVS